MEDQVLNQLQQWECHRNHGLVYTKDNLKKKNPIAVNVISAELPRASKTSEEQNPEEQRSDNKSSLGRASGSSEKLAFLIQTAGGEIAAG